MRNKQMPYQSRFFTLSAVGMSLGILALANLGGCTPAGSYDVGNDVGVTTGGAEDNAAARSQIIAGYIPDPAAITVEGFMSEHDIPLPRPENPDELFASMAVAYRKPFGEPAPMADVFIGFGSTIDLDAFKRPPLNLVVVVDRSGSMNDAASAVDAGSKMDAVKDALYRLRDQLNGDDLLTIVSFNTRHAVDLAAARGDDRDAAAAAIDKLRPLGNTNIFAALEKGFDLAAAGSTDLRSDRLILFTDALPNKGPEGSPDFVSLIAGHAAAGIGFTLMGVGADFGAELAKEIANVRDANSFFLADAERIATVFDKDFDFLVTPAAYDVELEVRLPAEVGIRNVYGVADYTPGDRGALIRVPTLFFSRREGGGAIVVRLTSALTPTFEQDTTLGAATLSFTLPDGTTRSADYTLTIPAGTAADGDPPYYSDPTARRAALLLDTVLALRGAAIAGVEGRFDAGRAGLEAFLPYFDAMSIGLSDRLSETDRALGDERALIQRLMDNLYPSYYGGYYWF